MRRAGLAAAFALLVGIPCGGASPQHGPVGRALLVGATRYPFLREEADAPRVDLRGPGNDVALLAETLTQVLEIPSERIQTLVGWPDQESERPTLANIRNALERLAMEAQPGELVLVFLAGHGVQQPAAPDDANERDGLDEVFLPADAAPDEEREDCFRFALTDDELGRALERIQRTGARVWLAVDACHSATLQRGGSVDDEVRTRTLPPEVHSPPPPTPREHGEPETGASADQSGDGVIAFYAAQSYQKAPEMKLPRGSSEYRGFFSYTLATSLARAGSGATFAELFELMKAGYAAWPCRVTPAAEGDLSQAILGGGERGHRLLAHREAGTVARRVLNAGSLHGMVPGNRLRLYPVGQRGQEEAVLGEWEIQACDWTRSYCKVPADAAADFTGNGSGPWAAELHEVMVVPEALQVSFHDAQGRPLGRDDWTDALHEVDQDPSLTVVDPLLAEVQVRLRPDDALLHHLARDSYHTAPLDDVRMGLLRIFRVKNLLRLTGDELRTPFPSGLDVVFELLGEEGERRPMQEGERYRPGVLGDIEIRNQLRGDQSHDLWVFQVTSDFAIHEVFPAGREATLSGRDSRAPDLRGPWLNTDATSGPEYLVTFALPAGSPSLSFLQQPDLRRVETMRGSARPPMLGLLDVLATTSEQGALRGVRVRRQKDVPAVRALAYQTGWPSTLEPWPRSTDARNLDARTPPFSLGEGLEPWNPAPGGILLTGADRVLAGQDRFDWFLLDLDGDTPLPQDPQAACAVLAAGGFDAELAIHVGDQGQCTFLDRSGDGRFDQMLVDQDRDGWAESRWQRDAEAGVLTTGLHLPWLRLADLPFPDHRTALPALQKVNALFDGPPR